MGQDGWRACWLNPLVSDDPASAHEGDEPVQVRTGPGGIAFLPPRDPPIGQRYRISLGKIRDELDRYLPAARREAADRLQALVKNGAPEPRIVAARIELAYLRHAKGPTYQSHLLTHLGHREVDAVISPQQTHLERVREIGAALATRINSQQPANVLRAVRALERPIQAPGQSPAHEHLAETFLKNSADQNKADPGLAGAQAVVDKAQTASQARGDGPRRVEAATDAARTAVAANIRAGKPFDDGISFPASSTPKAPDQGRSR